MDRASSIQEGELEEVPGEASLEYMTWYKQRTRLLIGNPSLRPLLPAGYQGIAPANEMMVDTLHRVYYRSLEALPHDEAISVPALTDIRDMCQSTMRAIGCEMRLKLLPLNPIMPLSMDEELQHVVPRARVRRATQKTHLEFDLQHQTQEHVDRNKRDTCKGRGKNQHLPLRPPSKRVRRQKLCYSGGILK
nr:uncharacterized protein LOC113693355 [Coffea arabica]